MKKIKNVLVLALLFIFIISCGGNDDDVIDFESLIIGNWEFVSSTTDGTLDPDIDCLYEISFNTTTIFTKEYYGDNCENVDAYSLSYTLAGDEFTWFDDGEEYTVIISKLTQTILEFTETYDNEVSIYTYRRL